MSRVKGVGRQAAADNDFIQLRDLNAALAVLPSLYVQNSRINQPNGVPGLDANSRMGNVYLPTDISRTTLTSSGKTQAGSLGVTGAASVGGTLSASGNATVGGSLGVTSGLTAGSVDVGGGNVNAATASIPEVTSDTFKAKATTLASLSVTGTTSLADLTTTGNTVHQAVSATALSSSGGVTATGEVNGGSVRSTGSLIADGATSLQALTVAGASTMQAVTAAGALRANGGLRIGSGQTVTQVDSTNALVPVAFGSAGVAVNGPLTAVSALSMSGAITTTGKVTAGDLESSSNLRINGSLLGVTDLSIAGNLNVQGSGKQINATKVATLTQEVTGQSTLAGSMTSTQVHLLLNGVSLRQYGSRFEIYRNIDNGATWQPNLAYSGMERTSSYVYNIGNATDTILDNWDTLVHGTSDHTGAVINAGNQGLYGRAAGVYLAHFKMTFVMYVGRHWQCSFTVNGTRRTETFIEGTTGGGPGSPNTTDDYTTIQNTAILRLNAGDIVRVVVWQRNDNNSIRTINNSFDRPEFSLSYLGAY